MIGFETGAQIFYRAFELCTHEWFQLLLLFAEISELWLTETRPLPQLFNSVARTQSYQLDVTQLVLPVWVNRRQPLQAGVSILSSMVETSVVTRIPWQISVLSLLYNYTDFEG